MQQVMRVLRKLYKYENSQYDGERAVSTYSLDLLSDKERTLLNDTRWQANQIECFADHQDIMNKLHSLKHESALTRQRCLDAFVAGSVAAITNIFVLMIATFNTAYITEILIPEIQAMRI
ncbi:hypothetical protein QS795_014290 [Providencia zhijiangensis]|uniref:SMODS and SLOG-associating 2TM effector domain-containing protein n=1 Tax=Providencia zhijiangensis TaxID=3053982 RepID=A0ABZ0MZT2_9GAMM|nr:hypothetical protein [Providencia sp. D4759]WPA91628.1 hypothetical protein QS795_014290 [Providencia sp. D4759]